MIDLKNTLRIQTASGKNAKMLRYIKKQLKAIGGVTFYQDNLGSIYATKGSADLYTCMVAHTDTVHNMVPESNFQIYTDKNILFSIDTRSYKRCGIGGDDKVGVYLALKMMASKDRCKAAFFVDEEIGCVGSASADLKFFKDVNLCLQADRKNVREVTSSINSIQMYGKEFADMIEPIVLANNFKEVDGGTTDVGQLGGSLRGIPMFNVACGYYRPHTDNEYVNIQDVRDTYIFLESVFDMAQGRLFDADWKRETWTAPSYDTWGLGGNYYGSQLHYGKSKWKSKKKVDKRDTHYWSTEDMCWVERGRKKCENCDGKNWADGLTLDERWCMDCGRYQFDGTEIK